MNLLSGKSFLISGGTFPSVIVLSVIQCVFKVEMVPVYHERCDVSYLLSLRPQGLLSLGVKATAPGATRLYDT